MSHIVSIPSLEAEAIKIGLCGENAIDARRADGA